MLLCVLITHKSMTFFGFVQWMMVRYGLSLIRIFDFVKTFQWIEGQTDMNKAVFVGCSWSWGQGLELASPTSYGVDWANRSQQWRELTTEQFHFIQTHRWSKKIVDTSLTPRFWMYSMSVERDFPLEFLG